MGMMLAARADSPIERLVVVDVGPFVPKLALDSIKSYVWKAPVFDSVAELKDHLKQVYPVSFLSRLGGESNARGALGPHHQAHRR
jgi:hypothetical protein